jgi:hypothetical protein
MHKDIVYDLHHTCFCLYLINNLILYPNLVKKVYICYNRTFWIFLNKIKILCNQNRVNINKLSIRFI